MEFRGGVRAGWCVAGSFLFFAATGAVPSAAFAADAQILYFEPLRISVPASERSQQKTSAHDLRKLAFSAYGRAYALSVEANETFHASLAQKPSRSTLKLYRGAIDGLADSWVRLATRGGDVHGMIWDGEHAYVIAPSDEVRDQLVPPLQTEGDTVIFRLSDVLLVSPAMSCASDATEEQRRASEAYESLTSEIQQSAVNDGTGATKRIELAVLGDSLFFEQHADAQEARESILIRMNNVDGIFSSQLGVQIQVPTVDVHTPASDPFSSERNASALLSELADLRRRTPELRARGLTHLFTGRDLEGSTIGIGYVGSLCDAKYGSGLTEVTHRGSWYESLIAAHEIGHNFGAVHDGESDKACESTPQGVYLMSPNVNGSESFSQCSLESMQPRIARAYCITALPPANISIALDLGTWHRPVGSSFDWELPVANAGGITAAEVRAEILVPPAVVVEEAHVVGGSCTSGAGVIQCQLGSIAGGSSRSVHLTLRSDVVASNSISAKVFAHSESTADDNEGSGSLVIDPEADVSVSAEGPTQVSVADPFDVRFTLANAAVINANAVRATIQIPANFVARSTVFDGGACTIEGTAITCSLGLLGPGASSEGTISLTATRAGNATIELQIAGSYVDPNASNDAAELTVEVSSAVTASPSQGAAGGDSSSGSSGGGGAGNAILLTLLGALAAARRRRR
jgi:hypothetical protein